MKEKVLFKRVGKKKKGGRKISLFGLKKKFLPFKKTFYQKHLSHVDAKLEFNPRDYDSKDPSEKRDLAYEDARNHKHFYEELIKSGVYPSETKVRVKRKKHSDVFGLEFSIPKLKTLDKYFNFHLPSTDMYGSPKLDNIEERKRLRGEAQNKMHLVRGLAKKKGYNVRDYSGVPPGEEDFADLAFSEDFKYDFNYGLDSKGEVKYLDLEVLQGKLPFEGRKNSLGKRLEKTVLGFVSVGCLILSFFFSVSFLTGGIIFTEVKNQNYIGGGFFIFGLIFIYFYKKAGSKINFS